MTQGPDPPALDRSPTPFLRIRLAKWLRAAACRTWTAARWIGRFLLISWASLAIYYSNLPFGWARVVLAVAFAALGIWALWIARRRRAMRWAFAGAFVAVLVWFSCIPPSNNRQWRPEVAVLPRAIIDGDRVRFTGVRSFDYRSENDFTPRYEERQVLISHLTAVDLLVSYWNDGGLMAHTFVSFSFDNAPPICVSIEIRPEVNERFTAIGSMFKQFELIYVVGDERDLIGVRTNHRDEEVYLYRIRTSSEDARRLFQIYCDRINELAEHPEYYHLLSNNCTVNIVRCANRAGRVGEWNIRHLLNGLVDRYVYHSGAVDTTLPFDELRRRSRITPAAQAAAHAPDFSKRIREMMREEESR